MELRTFSLAKSLSYLFKTFILVTLFALTYSISVSAKEPKDGDSCETGSFDSDDSEFSIRKLLSDADAAQSAAEQKLIEDYFTIKTEMHTIFGREFEVNVIPWALVNGKVSRKIASIDPQDAVYVCFYHLGDVHIQTKNLRFQGDYIGKGSWVADSRAFEKNSLIVQLQTPSGDLGTRIEEVMTDPNTKCRGWNCSKKARHLMDTAFWTPKSLQ